MKERQFLIITIIVALVLSACSEPVETPKDIELDLKSQQLVTADNTFGLELFKQIRSTEKANFNISPLSISLALTMTYNGAKDDTKLAMEEALNLKGLTVDEINASYKSLIDILLNTDAKVNLGIAQSIWYRDDFNVLEEFKSVNETYFDAEVKALDFGKAGAVDVINGWIENKTNNKIKNMIERIDPNHVMFLINAIYFNADWKYKFQKDDTKQETFYISEGESIAVDMMQKKDSVNYFKNNLFSAIEMPYGIGNFNMVVLLPNDGKNCEDIASVMTHENWTQWMNSFQMESDVNIWLPKFKDEYKIKLNTALKAMGMEDPFTPNANFNGINGNGGIWIDYVQHNTFIDVNEEGTEAAAATVVAMIERAIISPSFHANKPFIYAITERETGAILFLGNMKQPKYN